MANRRFLEPAFVGVGVGAGRGEDLLHPSVVSIAKVPRQAVAGSAGSAK